MTVVDYIKYIYNELLTCSPCLLMAQIIALGLGRKTLRGGVKSKNRKKKQGKFILNPRGGLDFSKCLNCKQAGAVLGQA